MAIRKGGNNDQPRAFYSSICSSKRWRTFLDFNQTIPQGWQPDPIFQSLIVIFAPPLSIATAKLTDSDGKLLIDHIATFPILRFSLEQLLPKESAAGLHLSDHTGVVAEIL